MTYANTQQIPLVFAYLCQDCNCISNSARQCPACASVALMGLSRVLNREPKVKNQLGFVRLPAIAA
jgi:hypothetical protein